MSLIRTILKLCLYLIPWIYIEGVYKEGYNPKVNIDPFCQDEFKCQKKYVHSTCTYKCEVGPSCKNFKAWELDNERRQYVLDLHNFYRNFVAVGNETRGFLKNASNMKALNYERAHEPVAHCWMKRCTWGHDECRGIKGIQLVGQNAMHDGRDKMFEQEDLPGWNVINKSVFYWYEEVAFMQEGDTEKMRATVAGSPTQIGHATQVLWAETYNVGCALTRHQHLTVEPVLSWFFFCNYGATGNWEGKQVYKVGLPASECAMYNLAKSLEYEGLCGDMYAVSKKRRTITATIEGVQYSHSPVDTGKMAYIDEDDDEDADHGDNLRFSLLSLGVILIHFRF